MNALHVRALAVVVALAPIVGAAGCAIAENDPLPSLGAVCIVSEGKCGVEHVCRPDDAGADRGTCVPVASYGAACDDAKAVTHPPGRNGDDVDNDEIVIRNTTDAALLDGVRSVTGQVRTERAEGPAAPDLVELGALCAFRDVQRVGDGLGIGKTDVVDLNGLQSLTSITGGLALFSNPSLVSLEGLENLAHIEPGEIEGASFDVVIIGNDDLTDEVADAFVTALTARVGRPLDAVVCANDGRDCPAAVNVLVGRIIANGINQ